MSQAETFLRALWGDKDDRGSILLWDAQYDHEKDQLIHSHSSWASSGGELLDVVQKRSKSKPPREFYIGCGLRKKSLDSTKRGGSRDIIGVPGLWAEIDFGKSEVVGKKYPPDKETALALLQKLHLRPSLIIHSGHGLHLWWLFKEVWYFDKEEEKHQFSCLIKDWQRTLIQHAQEAGYSVDSIHDLSRVLRIPGTTNNKDKEMPVRVSIENLDEIKNGIRRYEDWREFENYITVQKTTEIYEEEGGPVSFDENANPPVEKLEYLLKASKKFAATYKRERPDFEDQSASPYCLAMAYYASECGWTNQEIVDLLISWRRKFGEKTKPVVWYLKQIIGRARVSLAENKASKNGISEIVETDDRERILELFSQIVQTKISDFVQFGEEEPLYKFGMDEGRSIFMTDIQLDQFPVINRKFRAKTRKQIPPMKPFEWAQVLGKILTIIEVKPQRMTERRIELEEWLGDYMTLYGLGSDRYEGGIRPTVSSKHPFVHYDQEYIGIHARHFVKWLIQQEKEPLRPKDVYARLESEGFQGTDSDRVYGQRYWRAPLNEYRHLIDQIDNRDEAL